MKIVLCIDNPNQNEMLSKAQTLANSNSEFHLLHEITPRIYPNHMKEGENKAEERAERVLYETQEKIPTNFTVKTEAVYGENPTIPTIEYAQDIDADFILVGHRQNVPEKHQQYCKSFAKKLLSNSNIPIIVFPR